MDKKTLKTIISVVGGAETAMRLLPGKLYQKPVYKGAFGAIASVTGLVAFGQAAFKKDAFNKGNRLNTAIILCLSTVSVLQGARKIKQAYNQEKEQSDLIEDTI